MRVSSLRPVAIHQFVPVLAARDAVGSHALVVQDLLREMGFDSEIFVARADPDLGRRARPFRSYRARPGAAARTWLLYQCSTGNLMGDFVAERPEPKLLSYHNVTPAELLEAWDPLAVHAVSVGRHQLARLAPAVKLGIAMSRFNQDELMAAGCQATAVVPPLLDLAAFEQEPDSGVLQRLNADHERGGADLLFVGRISPNKAQHDLVKALAAYRQAYDPQARLHLVGGVSSPAYRKALGQLVSDLGLGDAVNFAGSVSQSALIAYYQAADLFVTCSDHEGFCLPLLEAMYHQTPVLAYDAGAVVETVGAAGVVLPAKGAAIVAAGVNKLIADDALRKALTAAGEARLQDLSPRRNRARFKAAIEQSMEGAAPDEPLAAERWSWSPLRSRRDRPAAPGPADVDRP